MRNIKTISLHIVITIIYEFADKLSRVLLGTFSSADPVLCGCVPLYPTAFRAVPLCAMSDVWSKCVMYTFNVFFSFHRCG